MVLQKKLKKFLKKTTMHCLGGIRLPCGPKIDKILGEYRYFTVMGNCMKGGEREIRASFDPILKFSRVDLLITV